MNIEQAYRAKRAKHPDAPALQCLRMARAAMKETARKIPRYVGDDVVIELPRGESILVQLEYDSDADIDERLNCETDTRRSIGRANLRCYALNIPH